MDAGAGGRHHRADSKVSALVTLLFCGALEAAREQQPSSLEANTSQPAYQDDNYIVGRAVDIASGWRGIVDALSASGHESNLTKTELWIPGAEKVLDAELPADVQWLCTETRRAKDGLKVMGAACQGDFASAVGSNQLLLDSARQRMEKAAHFGQRIVSMS